MKRIKVYTVEEFETRIVRALKNAKYGLEVRYLFEATDPELLGYRQFSEALGNLQMQGKVAYREDLESYLLVK